MHPEGVHAAKVIEHGLSYTQNENLQVVVRFETEHGFISGFFVLTDKAAKWTIEKLRAMGYRGEDFAELNHEGLLIGNECDITVEHEEYGGQWRAKIGWVNPLGEGGGGGDVKRDPVAAKNARRFNAMLKKMPSKGGEAPPPRRREREPEPPPEDEELPF